MRLLAGNSAFALEIYAKLQLLIGFWVLSPIKPLGDKLAVWVLSFGIIVISKK